MKIHHLRNATFVIEANNNFILVDPMLGKKGSIPPFTFFRRKAIKNPIVELPGNSNTALEKVTHCLGTHLHPDHFDKKGVFFLKKHNIPVICSIKDSKKLLKKGLNVSQTLEYWKTEDFFEGKIKGIPAKHGYGFIARPMGNVMGFYIELPRQPSIYISSDTVYTKDVDRVLTKLNPSLTVLACGLAQLDFGKPLMMRLEEVIKFIRNSPNKVYANHLEALNHCPMTRKNLKRTLMNHGLFEKVFVPNDGESFEID